MNNKTPEDEMRANVLAHINMVKVIRPMLTPEALRKFIDEEQRRIAKDRQQPRRPDDGRQDVY